MQEIVKRLQPGARLAVLELGFPSFPPARWFVRYGVPAIGWALSGGKLLKEYTYLNDSMYKMRLDDISDMMAEAGLKLVHRKTMNFGSVGLYVGEKAA
jgi:ubiquinone/menaquinone biosynthesis C-methylase UbiE